jgi:fructose-bisphosphate aldolase class I
MMKQTALDMVAKGKGILAADESVGTMTKRLEAIKVESTLENRNDFRHTILSTSGLGKHISGVILFDETLRNEEIMKAIEEQGIIPGIKVDGGTKQHTTGGVGEKVTEGLDGLEKRLAEYHALGARFAKWRAVLSPQATCRNIKANAVSLSLYAGACQAAGLVPIVEPEILMDGTHSVQESYRITKRVLHAVFDQLSCQQVALDEMVLKPNMVLAGYDGDMADPAIVAELTVAALLDTVPASVPGIAFLSGGQSPDLSSNHLKLMNQPVVSWVPWNLTFSFGRALQQPALKEWGDKNGHERNSRVAATQTALLIAAARNGKATYGE